MVSPLPLRVVFMGTPSFAVPTLEALLGSVHHVVAVVTQPDRPKGRGQRTMDGPVKARALQAGLPVHQPATLKDPAVLDWLASLRADLGVVAAYGKILPEAVIRTPRLGMINVHASLLPKYRGAAPIQRAVAAGETETGVTIMRVVKALDAGAMLATVRRRIGPDDTAAEVEQDLARLGAALLVETVDRMSIGPIDEPAQDDRLATYASRLTKEEGLVDWSRPAREIHDRVRGLSPWPHAYSYLAGRRLILLRSAVLDDVDAEAGAGSPPAPPGAIVSARGDELRVATGRGHLALREVQAEGKRPMPVREFLAGHPVPPGSRFSSSPGGPSTPAPADSPHAP
ncbi:MAG: methionyl-tRNA formyltransferase [Vicinamibacterales bacterium]